MEASEEYVFEQFLEAYGEAPRPQVFGTPDHCEECAEAEALVSQLDVSDLNGDDLDAWFFPAWAGEKGFRHFLPGMVRVVLENPRGEIDRFYDFAADHYLEHLETKHLAALSEVIEYCRDMGFADNDCSREFLREAIQRISNRVEQDAAPQIRPR